MQAAKVLNAEGPLDLQRPEESGDRCEQERKDEQGQRGPADPDRPSPDRRRGRRPERSSS